MENFKEIKNVLDITPEHILKDWRFGFQLALAKALLANLTIAKWSGYVKDDVLTEHINPRKINHEVATCKIIEVSDIYTTSATRTHDDTFASEYHQEIVSAKVTCECGKLSKVSGYREFYVGNLISTITSK